MTNQEHNRWWITGATFQELKDYLEFESVKSNEEATIYHAGTGFSIEAWEDQLNRVHALSVGDPIWNPYKSKWTKIVNIHLTYSSETEWAYRGFGGEFVDSFWIDDDKGYRIYEILTEAEVKQDMQAEESPSRDPKQNPAKGDVIRWAHDAAKPYIAIVTEVANHGDTTIVHWVDVGHNGYPDSETCHLEDWQGHSEIQSGEVLYVSAG